MENFHFCRNEPLMVIMTMAALWTQPKGVTPYIKRGTGDGMAFIMQNFCVIDWHE
jgi:hypothetical protein